MMPHHPQLRRLALYHQRIRNQTKSESSLSSSSQTTITAELASIPQSNRSNVNTTTHNIFTTTNKSHTNFFKSNPYCGAHDDHRFFVKNQLPTLLFPCCFNVFCWPNWGCRLKLWWSTFMASPADLAVHEPTKIVRRKRSSGKQVKLEELEREVLMLRKMLDDEQKVHEILEGVHHQRDHSSLYPSFLPPKAKELLAELAMVEDEIARLERQIGQLQTDLDREKQVTKDRDVSQKLQPPTLNNKPQYGFSLPSPNLTNFIKGDSERMPFETKALHFISKAIKGDYNLRDFTANDQKLRNLSGFSDRQENNFHDHHEAGLPQEKIPRKNGVLLKPSSPLRETRHLTPRRDRILEIPLDLPPKSAANPIQSEEENIQKWPPNKLAENIMKCLIFIFVRLLRTSRAMELEKSGAISRSANFSSSSRSFRVDTNSSNSKASFMLQRESRQQDPYGVFSTKESIPRDIGPYKNLVVFTSRNLDPKCISNSNSAPLVQRLRVLVNSLQKVELRLLTYQQKLAFWINVYNACIMHGFIQYGVPSSPEKLLTLMNKATLNVGGNTINAHTIEHYILRKPASSILKEVSRKVDVEDKEVTVRRLYGLESPDPNVTFSLCCGTRSSPAVRIYTAEGVVGELEKSKLEYLQASIVVTSGKRMALPELLLRNMYDFAPDMDSLVEWVCHQLPTSGSLRKSIVECFRSLNSVSGTTTTSGSAKISSVVDKIPYDFEFQYLLSI